MDRPWEAVEPDADAVYEREVIIDLSALRPTVSLPHLPSNTKTVDEAAGMSIQQVVIGSCTNGRLKDLQEAADILKGRQVAKGVRCIVIPATQQIYMDAMAQGLIQTFIESGCAVSTPTCGPCLGGHMGVLADGERAVSTTNRNFVGRMGPVSSEIILARLRRGKVSSVDKANVLETSRLWRSVMHRLAGEYPDVAYEDVLVDNCAMQLVRDPGQFDVVVTENMFGDILSDEASMVTGSIGLLPSASIGDAAPGLYEPIHGSAPDIAGQDKANPIATILSVAMMFRYSFQCAEEAAAIEHAVDAVLAEGWRTPDIAEPGTAAIGTREMGRLIREHI